MTAFSVTSPFPVFTDLKGEPLENGQIFIGKPNLNPETDPISVFFNAGLDQPAAQPIDTLAGYVSRNGTPSDIFVSQSSFSITVRDKKGNLVFSKLNSSFGVIVNIESANLEFITDIATLDLSSIERVECNFRDTNKIEGGGGILTKVTSGSADSGKIFADLVGTLFQRQSDGPTSAVWYGAAGDGATDDTTAIDLADASGDFTFTPGQYVYSGSVLASKIDFEDGASLLPSAVTLTFSDEVSAPRTEIFKGTSDIVLNGSEMIIFPEWFGIFNAANGNDGTVDLDSNSKRLMRCAGDSKGTALFGHGKYFMRDIFIDSSDTHIKGQGIEQTIIQNATINNGSTRLGNFTGIFAPTADGNPARGNRTWTGVVDIVNCSVTDLTMQWSNVGITPDLTMNGIVALGVTNALIENCHVDMDSSNRAFYVAVNETNQKTRDVLVSKCTSDNCITGGFISSGFTANAGTVLKNITFRDCTFEVIEIASGQTGGPSCGFFVHGGNTAANLSEDIIRIEDSRTINGAVGVLHTPPDVTTRIRSKVIISGCVFTNFKEHGILTYNLREIIKDCVFDSTNVETVAIQAGAIVCFTNANGGPENIDIIDNTFKNVSGTGSINCIHINPVAGLVHNIINNRFTFENGLKPTVQIFFNDATGILGDVILKGNRFDDASVINVTNTTVNDEMLIHDDGSNRNLNLSSRVTYLSRAVTIPIDSRRYERGTKFSFASATSSAASHEGQICFLAGTPGSWRNTNG